MTLAQQNTQAQLHLFEVEPEDYPSNDSPIWVAAHSAEEVLATIINTGAAFEGEIPLKDKGRKPLSPAKDADFTLPAQREALRNALIARRRNASQL